jgi:hypothetical protein
VLSSATGLWYQGYSPALKQTPSFVGKQGRGAPHAAMTVRSSRELVWAVQVNDVLSADLLDLIGADADIDTIAEAIHEAN